MKTNKDNSIYRMQKTTTFKPLDEKTFYTTIEIHV